MVTAQEKRAYYKTLTEKQRKVYDAIKILKGFYGPTAIAKEAIGIAESSRIAPTIKKLLNAGIIERNSGGCYRMKRG